MGSPWHLLALLLLPTSLAPTLHHRAYAVAVPPITEGALAPPVGGVTGRASTNDAPNATEELEALKHHGVDRTAAWDALELGGAESTATPDRPDLGQSSLKDARGPAALGNVFAGTPRESGEAVAVAEDDARNGTGARLTARLSLNGPRLSTLRGEESPSESLETFLVATSPSPEEDAFSPVTMSGDSSQDQVRNTDAPTRAVTSLDDSVLEEGVSRTTAFPEEAWVSDISPTLNTTEGVVAPNLPSSRETAEVRPLETTSPEVLDVWTEDSGNGSRRRPADTSTEEPYGVSEPQAPPATSSSGEVTTARRVTDQEEGAFANASVPIATSVEVEASAPPNGTFALEEDGLWVHLVSTQTATGPAVDRTEERQLPVTTTPAESFVEDLEVLSPAKSTTSLESAAVGDDALTTIPARDLDAVETPSSREESATQTDFTEDAAPTNRPDTVGLTTQLPASTPPCVPLEPPRGLTHEFRLVFRTASEFSWERVEALERRIQGFLRDGPCPRRFARTAFALGPPHVLSWTDPSANATWCDHASVEALLRTMRSESGRPTPAITRAFYPEFLISSVELQLRGACASEAGAFPIVAAVVGTALSAALLAGLLAVLCRYLRPRSRRLDVTPAGDSFDLKQRRPVLLPGLGGLLLSLASRLLLL
ncbi:gastric mucin, putative [Ixodes scapularis]|uniref:Gastric mucin, putative n=1 Tax=Ixodes scapularis TaxID=6945 RepID=B7Q906_IXOSC|nr:gastric mucin, putative [Ixodes scapularis]|eukprot:XP_002412439.1 gastric mucin, putative [Ixodes scapularis]